MVTDALRIHVSSFDIIMKAAPVTLKGASSGMANIMVVQPDGSWVSTIVGRDGSWSVPVDLTQFSSGPTVWRIV